MNCLLMAHQRWLFKCPKPGLSLAVKRSPRPLPCQSELREERKAKAQEQAGFQGPIPSQGCVPHVSLLAGRLGTVTRDQQPCGRAQP